MVDIAEENSLKLSKLENKPVNELQQLEIFVGEWKVKGQNLEGATINANTQVNGVETYEWMPGKFFLINKWDRHFGVGEHTGIGVICYDAVRKEFVANNYDNLGYARVYKLTMYGNVWHFTGSQERAVMKFSADGQQFTERWEILKDGEWSPLCFLEGSKA